MNDTPAHFIAVCPSCLTGLRVNYEYSGRMVRCRHCDEAFRPFSPDFGSASGSSEYAVGPVEAPEGPPDLVVSCPKCATTLSVRARYAGRHVRCGGCQHKFRVDREARAADDSAARLADDPASADAEGRTPDPEAKRSELSRLIEEVAALRDHNTLLLRRYDDLKRQVDDLNALVQQLEADRDAAESRIADLTDRIDRNASLIGPLGLAPLDDQTPDDDHEHDDDRRATFPFHSERSASSGR
jgi:hypothetical protein